MVLHLWLIPALALLGACVFAFYISVRISGGSGQRTDGRTLVHKADDEDKTLPV